MRFWSGFTTFEIVAYLLSAASIVVLAVLANARQIRGLESVPLKKIAWGLLAISIAYWVISVPESGTYEHDLNSRLRLQADLESSSQEAMYIHDHHYRIEELEYEVKQARADVRELNQHYRRLSQLLLAGVFVYAASFILTPRRTDDDDQIKLGLDEQ